MFEFFKARKELNELKEYIFTSFLEAEGELDKKNLLNKLMKNHPKAIIKTMAVTVGFLNNQNRDLENIIIEYNKENEKLKKQIKELTAPKAVKHPITVKKPIKKEVKKNGKKSK